MRPGRGDAEAGPYRQWIGFSTYPRVTRAWAAEDGRAKAPAPLIAAGVMGWFRFVPPFLGTGDGPPEANLRG